MSNRIRIRQRPRPRKLQLVVSIVPYDPVLQVMFLGRDYWDSEGDVRRVVCRHDRVWK